MRKLTALLMAAIMLLSVFGAACSKTEKTEKPDNSAKADTEETANPSPDGGDATAAPTDDPDQQDPDPVFTTPVIVQPAECQQSMSASITDNAYVWCSLSYAILQGNEAEKYPALAAALSERGAFIENEAERLVAEIAEKAEPNDNGYYEAFEAGLASYIRRSDSTVFSVLYEETSEIPQSVPNRFFADNFDTATGKRLALADVVNDPSSIPHVINEIMGPRNEDGFTLDAGADYSRYFSDPDCRDFAWTLDYNGISLFFNDNAFGIEDAWMSTAFVPFSRYPDLVKAKYMAAPEAYVTAFPPDITCYFELGDKVFPLIVTALNYEDDSGYAETYAISVTCGDSTETDYLELEGLEPVFIHDSEGDFLCIDCPAYNDYSYFSIASVTEGKLSKLKTYPFRWAGDYCVDETGRHYYIRETVVDPNNCTLAIWTEVLSSMICKSNFSFGQNGVPVTDAVFYTAGEPIRLTVLRDFEAELTDVNGSDLGTVTISKGSIVDYVATDAEKIAVLSTEQGLVKIDVVKASHEWRFFVNGVDIFDLFDGLVFAG